MSDEKGTQATAAGSSGWVYIAVLVGVVSTIAIIIQSNREIIPDINASEEIIEPVKVVDKGEETSENLEPTAEELSAPEPEPVDEVAVIDVSPNSDQEAPPEAQPEEVAEPTVTEQVDSETQATETTEGQIEDQTEIQIAVQESADENIIVVEPLETPLDVAEVESSDSVEIVEEQTSANIDISVEPAGSSAVITEELTLQISLPPVVDTEQVPALDVAAVAPDASSQDINIRDGSDVTPSGTSITLGAVSDTPPGRVPPQANALPRSVAVEEPEIPTFDLVRIDASGGGLVVGRAEPGTTVRVLIDGSEIATTEANSDGEFVAFVQTPAADEGQILSLQARNSAGNISGSAETILILPSDGNGKDATPILVRAEPDNVRVIAPSGLGKVEAVTLEAITYNEEGDVVLSGRAPGTQPIRIYVNAALASETVSSGDGSWRAVIDEVDEGRYVLRVDAIRTDGTVQSRVESPFQRVFPTDQQRKLSQVTVQPGNTLWVMAEERYGDGFNYTQIFAANKTLIRNPDLIYPGQIFELPNLPAGQE